MSYDPHSWICIPIHYAPVELKIGTLRGATDRALHGTSKGVVGGGGRAGGSRDDKSKGPPARRVASLSPSPLPADRSPPPLLSFSLFLVALSLTVRLPFTLSARCMQMFALALMARQRGRSRGNETTESVQRQRRRQCEGRDLFSRARDSRCRRAARIARRRPRAQMY